MLANLFGYFGPTGKAYIAGKSTLHPEYPETQKITRINILCFFWYLEPTNNGKDTKLSYFTEVNF